MDYKWIGLEQKWIGLIKLDFLPNPNIRPWEKHDMYELDTCLSLGFVFVTDRLRLFYGVLDFAILIRFVNSYDGTIF